MDHGGHISTHDIHAANFGPSCQVESVFAGAFSTGEINLSTVFDELCTHPYGSVIGGVNTDSPTDVGCTLLPGAIHPCPRATRSWSPSLSASPELS